MLTIENGLFQKADEKLLTHMKERISNRLPVFLAPINMVLKESVQVAFMFNEIIHSFKNGPVYKTFFCNAHMEAVHGAIKIARHYMKTKENEYTGEVVIADRSGYYRNYFNPDQYSVVPGIVAVEENNDITETIQCSQSKILVVSVSESYDEDLEAVCRYCEQNGIVTILDLSRLRSLNDQVTRKWPMSRFHIICWGESCTRYQVPFGAFSTRKDIYRVWNNKSDCLTHTSTFGGNGMALSYVLRNMRDWFPVFSARAEYQSFF